MAQAHWLSRNFMQRLGLYGGLLQYGVTGQPKPRVVNLFLTSRCNAKCTYCYVADVNVPDDRNAGRRILCESEWLDLIDAFIARGCRAFTLVGGEPLLAPHLPAIVEHLYRRNVFFVLTTNGALVPKRIDLLRKVSQLTISIDGDRESNDRLRGKGWHARAMAAIEAAVAAEIPTRLNVVVTRANADQIGYIVDLCDRFGLCVTFTPYIDPPGFRRDGMTPWQIDDQGVKAFFAELRRWRLKSRRIMNSLESIDFMIGYPAAFDRVVMVGEPEAAYQPEPCPYGRIQYHLNEFSEVYPCGVWWNRSDFSPKSVFEHGIDAAIAHATAMPCQYCSFANAIDWIKLTRLGSAWDGAVLTLHQYLDARRGGSGQGTV